MLSKQRAALYSRLSRDDGIGESESNSITNQKEMLIRYAKENSFSIVDHYVDDGMGRLTSETAGNVTTSYSYDAYSNRASW